jgi:hypothetical protein
MTQPESTASNILNVAASAAWRRALGLWEPINAYHSPFLYIRLIFWLLTILISFLPFIGAETRIFSEWGVTFSGMYAKNYEAILAVFVVTIAVAMFDVLTVVVLLVKWNQSVLSVPAAVILGALLVLEIVVGLALGAAIMLHEIPPDQAALFKSLFGHMHGGILTFSAFVCLVATGFAAILTNEYAPPVNGKPSRNRK